MNYPKVKFTTDHTALANHLCYLGKQISCGYYQNRRFLVLPKPLKYGRSIYFPLLKTDRSFWDSFKHLTELDYVYHFPKTEKVALELLDQIELAPMEAKRKEAEAAWAKKEKPFFDYLKEFLPTYEIDKIEQIECLITPFGTMGSFHFDHLKNGHYQFHTTLRTDLGVSQVAEGIISLFFHIDNPLVTLTTWEHRESIMDFLLTKTKFAAIFDHEFIPTISDLPEINENLVAESEKYLASLGFPVKSILNVTNKQLKINDEVILNTFTQTERKILYHLIGSRNKLVSYDEIGDLFWGEEESLDKFSLQSIAKIMEKIRKKIKNHGVYQELIYTVRNEGYVLYD